MDVLRARCLKSALYAILLLALQIPVSSGSAPIVLEESERIVSPEPRFPLNGPLAVDGNFLIVSSATLDSVESTYRFAVYIFERPTPTGRWSFVQKLIELSFQDDMSPPFSLALEGTLATVAWHRGAYVFERTSAGWTQTALLTQPRQVFSDAAISGGRIVLGTNDGRQTGYIYQKDASGQWSFIDQVSGGLPPNDDSAFGPDLDIYADRIVIGSPNFGSFPQGDPGKLYLYRQQEAGSWSLISRLDSGPGTDNAGELAAAFNDLAFTAAGREGVVVFREFDPDLTPNDWGVLNHLVPLDAMLSGTVASLDLGPGPVPGHQGLVVFGSPADEDRGNASGSVTVSETQFRGNLEYIAVAKLLASNATPNLRLGQSVSVHERTLVASSRDGVYVFTLPQRFIQPKLQQDDFEDGNSAGWNIHSAAWSVVSSLGSRVYRQTRTIGEGRSILDGVDWTNQSIQADARVLGFNGAGRYFGLITRYIDDNNFYYAVIENTHRVRLKKRVNGIITVLGSAPLTVTPDRDYRVRLEAVGTWLRVYVDGNRLIQVRDTALTQGTVGLRTYWAQTQFDNVVVSPNPALRLWVDNFEGQVLQRWLLTPQGNWSNVASGGGRVIRQSVASGNARAITGVAVDEEVQGRADHIVEARARALSFISGQDPWFGLIARYVDDLNYTYITVNRNGYISLRKLVNGAIRVLDTSPLTVATGTWYALRLEAVGDRLRVYVNRRLTLEAIDTPGNPVEASGLYGLMTSRASAEFDDVRVTEP